MSAMSSDRKVRCDVWPVEVEEIVSNHVKAALAFSLVEAGRARKAILSVRSVYNVTIHCSTFWWRAVIMTITFEGNKRMLGHRVGPTLSMY